MLERAVRTVPVLASLVVLAGWVSFAVKETREASAQNTAAVEALGPNGDSLVAAPAAGPTHGGVRAAIDDASDTLVSPFRFLVSHVDSQWLRHTVPAAVALLVYGFGLSVLARVLRQGPP